MLVKRSALVLIIVIGLAGVVVFGYYAVQDWAVLQLAYARFESLAAANADLKALYVAEAAQNVHRTNLLAGGVWTLLSLLIAAVGVHGFCVTAGDGARRTGKKQLEQCEAEA